METLITAIRESIRSAKNSIIQAYFKARIYNTSSPYEILLKSHSHKILLLLSHMRSSSSLLTHLLVANPEIIGYGETQLNYQSDEDLKKLLFRVYWYGQEFRKIEDFQNLNMSHNYILDKILHDERFINYDFLTSPNITVIFLVREPQRTLSSMLDHKPHWTEKDALDYYQNRLLTLMTYAKFISNPERCFFLTQDQLFNQTKDTFTALQSFLQLKEGFSEEYQLLKTTGERHVGDFKEYIKTGRIVRNPRPLNINISPTILASSSDAYSLCTETLPNYCTKLRRV